MWPKNIWQKKGHTDSNVPERVDPIQIIQTLNFRNFGYSKFFPYYIYNIHIQYTYTIYIYTIYIYNIHTYISCATGYLSAMRTRLNLFSISFIFWSTATLSSIFAWDSPMSHSIWLRPNTLDFLCFYNIK